jgi:hypothetical protein
MEFISKHIQGMVFVIGLDFNNRLMSLKAMPEYLLFFERLVEY